MKEYEAFVRQARSDYATFQLLLEQDRQSVPACHPLHYLQMTTEKLAKAIKIATGDRDFDRYSHVAFSDLPTVLSRREVATKLGRENFKRFQGFLKRTRSVFRKIDELNPSVGMSQPGGGPKRGPNAEYPWQTRDSSGVQTWTVPATYAFDLIVELRHSADGVQVMNLVETLLERFEDIYG